MSSSLYLFIHCEVPPDKNFAHRLPSFSRTPPSFPLGSSISSDASYIIHPSSEKYWLFPLYIIQYRRHRTDRFEIVSWPSLLAVHRPPTKASDLNISGSSRLRRRTWRQTRHSRSSYYRLSYTRNHSLRCIQRARDSLLSSSTSRSPNTATTEVREVSLLVCKYRMDVDPSVVLEVFLQTPFVPLVVAFPFAMKDTCLSVPGFAGIAVFPSVMWV